MSGEIRYRITGWMTPRMQATLVIEGVECGFDGKLSQAYDGAISCDKWRGVPLSLSNTGGKKTAAPRKTA